MCWKEPGSFGEAESETGGKPPSEEMESEHSEREGPIGKLLSATAWSLPNMSLLFEANLCGKLGLCEVTSLTQACC